MQQKLKELLPFNGEGTILLGYNGSLAYGTFIDSKTTDKDYLGIFIPPINYILGLDRFEHTVRQKENIDITVYCLRKFLRLILKNNPNAINLLWLKREHYVIKTKLGQKLLDNRELFLSKECYRSFCGYAHGQLKRMTHFKKDSYMGKKRKELVTKFGYDCKNASHLIRILKMGIELLSTGEVNVWRQDAPILIEIKQGKWALEKVQKEADRLFKLLDNALVNSLLPSRPNKNKINKLCIEMLRDFHQIT